MYFDAIRDYIYYKCGDGDLATDITQETFMKLWEKKLSKKPEEIKGLLYKIAGNLLIDHFRKNERAQKYSESITLNLELNDPEKDLEYSELKKQYNQTLSELPENQREVFLMNRLEELTYKEIAGRLEISIKAVEKRMSKALNHLKIKILT